MPRQIPRRQAEKAFSDLLRELERCPAWLLTALIDAIMEDKGCSRDEAIREMAKFETTTKQILDALAKHRET